MFKPCYRLRLWFQYHIGCLANRFIQEFSTPGLVPHTLPPCGHSSSLTLRDIIDTIGKNADIALVVRRCFMWEVL